MERTAGRHRTGPAKVPLNTVARAHMVKAIGLSHNELAPRTGQEKVDDRLSVLVGKQTHRDKWWVKATVFEEAHAVPVEAKPRETIHNRGASVRVLALGKQNATHCIYRGRAEDSVDGATHCILALVLGCVDHRPWVSLRRRSVCERCPWAPVQSSCSNMA